MSQAVAFSCRFFTWRSVPSSPWVGAPASASKHKVLRSPASGAPPLERAHDRGEARGVAVGGHPLRAAQHEGNPLVAQRADEGGAHLAVEIEGRRDHGALAGDADRDALETDLRRIQRTCAADV